MSSPLTVFDVFNQRHVEPSVTGIVRLQETEPVRPDPVNDIIMLGTPRSGQPNVLKDFLRLSSVADYHDPDRSGDQFVAIARIAKTAISEQDMFGAARIRTCRIGAPTQSETTLKASSTSLVTIKTADYGSHTRRARRLLEAGTIVADSKKLTLRDDSNGRKFVGDNLGILLAIQYTGNGSAAAMTIRRNTAVITFTGQVADADAVTVATANISKTFEFESSSGVTAGRVSVTIGADADASMTNLATAISANVPGVTVAVNTTANTLTITAAQDGVVVTEVTDSTNKMTIAMSGNPANLAVAVSSPTDGSANLDIPLTSQQYKTIGQLAAYINNQLGYTCSVNAYADKSISSTGLDVVSAVDIKTAAVNLTGYVAAIVNWVNTQTRGNYVASIVATGEPDEDASEVFFTGGTTPVVTATHWENALDVLSAGVEKGGIILADTTDPAIMAMITEFIVEQRTAGKWFRAYFGTAAATSVSDTLDIAGSLDHSNVRLVCQRVGVFGEAGTITYLDPIFLAAALAGATAGNRPYDNPLTNKRFRFVGIHENDDFDLVTRESLLDGGVTVVKSELGVVKCAMQVTTSRDPDHRMARVASEIDTLYEIDAAIRDRFLKYRGKWADSAIVGKAMGELIAVLQEYKNRGALVDGVDLQGQPRSAFRLGTPAVQVNSGLLEAFYSLFIGGEVDHVSIQGGADYQRLVGIATESSSANIAVPIR